MRHNYHAGIGEIDLITVTADGVIHIVEVKAWHAMDNAESPVHPLVHPLESFTTRRRNLLRTLARTFLFEFAGHDPSCDIFRRVTGRFPEHPDEIALSFDLVWVRGEGCEYFPALF